jgi:hypothetical protein
MGSYTALVGSYRRFGAERLSQSVGNYQSALSNFPVERRPHSRLDGSLNSSPTSQRLGLQIQTIRFSWTAEPNRMQSSPTDRPNDRRFITEPSNLLLTSKLQWGMLAQAVTPREMRGSNLARDPDCSEPSFSCFFSVRPVIWGWHLKLGRCYFHVLCSLFFTIMSHSHPYSPNCWLHRPINGWFQAQRLPLIPSIRSLPHTFALGSTKCFAAIYCFGLWRRYITCCMFSSGQFPGVWILCADVSEHSVCSIFIGR